jgi:lysophospholipase L1-like esterase
MVAIRYFLLAFMFALGTTSAFSQTKIMFLGDSITKGAVDPEPSLSGFRAQLFDDLNKAGLQYQFVGCTINNSNRAMISAGQAYHNGYGSYQIFQIYKNLDGVEGVDGGGDDNMDGYWLTGGHGTWRGPVYPDIDLLLAGTNDLGAGAGEPELEKRMTDLLSWFATNRPKAQVFVATVPPRGLDKPGFEAYNQEVVAFNSWIARSLPTLGFNFHPVDMYSLFINRAGQVKMSDSSDGIFLKDGTHPSHNGYVAMGDAWFDAIKPLLKPAQP